MKNRIFSTITHQDHCGILYISARISYRAGLVEPFLWSSLHAIEKYLKALLLFNRRKVKGFGHDIIKLLNAAKAIEELDLRLPVQVESFIEYINEFGENRYFEWAAYLEEYALDNLDETIWYIRRYCYDRSAYEGFNLREIEPSYFEASPKEFKLPGGFLEKINGEKLLLTYILLGIIGFMVNNNAIDIVQERVRQNFQS